MKKILLEAPILTQSGYGEHSRLVYRSLQSLEDTDIYINPLSWGQTSWLSDFGGEREQIDECIQRFSDATSFAEQTGQKIPFDVQIYVGIPNEFEKRAPYSVCVTAGIETDRVDAAWLLKTYEGIDKLIVPSEHAKEGFENTSYQAINESKQTETVIECNCPVEVVPYPVKNVIPDPLDFKLDTQFNFLSIALLGHRKNLENMINWFVEEFKDDNVGLLLKTAKSTGSVLDRNYTERYLKEIINIPENDRKCKIYFLHGDLSEEQIHGLYCRKDIHAYVSATHGEGYGLPIFESVYSGMPVVATDWSGHLDLLSGPIKESGKNKYKKLFAKVSYKLKEIDKEAVWKGILSEGSQWAYPDKISFKKQLRNVQKNYGVYQKWAKILKKQVHETHDVENVLEMMTNSILSRQEKPEEVLVL